jgi:hypothetical protein
MGVGCQRHAPAALPPGKTRYPLYSRLGGPQGSDSKNSDYFSQRCIKMFNLAMETQCDLCEAGRLV